MSGDGIGLADDAIESEVDANAAPRSRDAGVDLLGPPAELGGDIRAAQHALARQLRIELKRSPHHLRRHGLEFRVLAKQLQRAIQPALADEAPGTNHVGNNLDAKRHDGSCPGKGPQVVRAKTVERLMLA